VSDSPDALPKIAPTRFWQKIGLVADISSLCRRLDDDQQGMVAILELIQRIVPFDAATLFLYDRAAHSFVSAAEIGEPVAPPSFLVLRSDKPGHGWKLRTKKSVLHRVQESDVDFEPDMPFEVVMIVPLLIDGAVVGVLCQAAYHANVLERKHVMLAEIVANQLAVAIERSNYVATIKASNRALATAHRELQTAQKRIIAAEKLAAVAELAASLNHEINNPLAVIMGHVQCLMMELADPGPKIAERLKRIELAAQRISDVNRKLLGIDTLVSEVYLDDPAERMLNLEKSTQG